MADITVTAANVGISDPIKANTVTGIAAVAITAGQAGYMNSSGKIALSDASAAGTAKFDGIAVEGVGAGQAVTLAEGEMTGFTLAGNYGSLLYLSDTAGALADAAGTPTRAISRPRNMG